MNESVSDENYEINQYYEKQVKFINDLKSEVYENINNIFKSFEEILVDFNLIEKNLNFFKNYKENCEFNIKNEINTSSVKNIHDFENLIRLQKKLYDENDRLDKYNNFSKSFDSVINNLNDKSSEFQNKFNIIISSLECAFGNTNFLQTDLKNVFSI